MGPGCDRARPVEVVEMLVHLFAELLGGPMPMSARRRNRMAFSTRLVASSSAARRGGIDSLRLRATIAAVFSRILTMFLLAR